MAPGQTTLFCATGTPPESVSWIEIALIDGVSIRLLAVSRPTCIGFFHLRVRDRISVSCVAPCRLTCAHAVRMEVDVVDRVARGGRKEDEKNRQANKEDRHLRLHSWAVGTV